MLRKIRANQQQALKMGMDGKRIPTPVGVTQNSTGTAYKPTLAVLNTNKMNGTAKVMGGKGVGGKIANNNFTANVTTALAGGGLTVSTSSCC
jgi:hypothetical protein